MESDLDCNIASPPVAENTRCSGVWSHFQKSKDGNCANCLRSNTPIQCKGGSTSGMRTHLKIKHVIVLPRASESSKGISFEW